ncbi:hypothetical protein, partial [Pseudoalteromonas luteoviolacea]|uniref:hypothetical protein n=1 Tax=Pseudoalteromonas luteoviolacea TaxID=43657 RepID=UPI000B243EA6
SECVFIEVGPSQSLSTLAAMHNIESKAIISSMPKVTQSERESHVMTLALGQAWQSGIDVDWQAYYEAEQRQRV